MSRELPKYKLSQRAPEAPKEELKAFDRESEPKQPLGLKAKSGKEGSASQEEVMTTTDEMLEDAYGASGRRRRRWERMGAFAKFTIALLFALVWIAATFFYAHQYEGWPVMEPIHWYLPFALSAAISAWVCLQSLKFWRDRSAWLAIFGILMAGLLVYGNLYLLKLASQSPVSSSERALSAPQEINKLYVTVEFNKLRGIPAVRESYTGFTSEEYKTAFKSIPREKWRPIFVEFLSVDEIRGTTQLNLFDNLNIVIDRLEASRGDAWNRLLERLEQPPLEFKALQSFVAPYTWLIGLF